MRRNLRALIDGAATASRRAASRLREFTRLDGPEPDPCIEVFKAWYHAEREIKAGEVASIGCVAGAGAGAGAGTSGEQQRSSRAEGTR